MTPCNLVGYSEEGDRMFFRNVGIHVPDCELS